MWFTISKLKDLMIQKPTLISDICCVWNSLLMTIRYKNKQMWFALIRKKTLKSLNWTHLRNQSIPINWWNLFVYCEYLLTCGQWSATCLIFECAILGDIIKVEPGWALVQIWISIYALHIPNGSGGKQKEKIEMMKNYSFE